MSAPRISVCFNTWRLGSLASVVASLEAQRMPDGVALDTDVELVIADELHRWRAPVVARRLAQCPFPVKHLPVERSLFPVASTMRASNTTLRAAEGELIVHACDGAVLPPNFLAAHWEAYVRDPKAIGICPYRGRTVRPEQWVLPPMDAWDMVESCIRAPGMAFWAAGPTDAEGLPAGGGSPALVETGTVPGQVVNEWFAHYKVDSVPRAAYLAVNGWDEEYDGGYIYADIDMTLRLMAAGYLPRVVGDGSAGPVEVPILDFHLVTKRTPDIAFRQWWMAARLSKLQKRLERDGQAFRCEEGLERPVRSHVNDAEAVAKGAGRPARVTLQRPWLTPRYPGGRLDVLATPEEAFLWPRIVPPVLYGWPPLDRVLGERGAVTAAPYRSVRLCLDGWSSAGAALDALPSGVRTVLFTGREAQANALIDAVNARGWPCEAQEIAPDLCGVMAIAGGP